MQRKYLAAAALLDPGAFADPGAAPMLEAVRYQAEHFDETPAVIAACYARPPLPRGPRLVAGLIRDLGMGFLRRLANPRVAVVAGASSSYPGVQNLLLAARALGLAANLTVWHFFAENEFKQVLGVPKQVTIYALVPVGWQGPLRAGAAPSGRGRGALEPVVDDDPYRHHHRGRLRNRAGPGRSAGYQGRHGGGRRHRR